MGKEVGKKPESRKGSKRESGSGWGRSFFAGIGGSTDPSSSAPGRGGPPTSLPPTHVSPTERKRPCTSKPLTRGLEGLRFKRRGPEPPASLGPPLIATRRRPRLGLRALSAPQYLSRWASTTPLSRPPPMGTAGAGEVHPTRQRHPRDPPPPAPPRRQTRGGRQRTRRPKSSLRLRRLLPPLVASSPPADRVRLRGERRVGGCKALSGGLGECVLGRVRFGAERIVDFRSKGVQDVRRLKIRRWEAACTGPVRRVDRQ